MSHPSKVKGDRGELEVCKLLADLLGLPVRRKLGAGRADDTGDVAGIPDTTIEVKSYADVTRAINDGLGDLATEQANSGDTFGAVLVRRRGGRWVAVMPLENYATYVRESIAEVP